MSANPQAKLGAVKYQKIIDAAVKVFAKKGFYNAKVSDVADLAKVADGTIYLYFKNKDDLLISIFENSMTEFFDVAKDKLSNIVSPADKLKAFIHLHLELLQKNQKLATVLQLELRSSHKFMKEYKAEKFFEYLRFIESIIKDGQQQNLFNSKLNAHIATRALFGAIDEMALEWVLTKNKDHSLQETANQLFSLFYEGIGESNNNHAPSS